MNTSNQEVLTDIESLFSLVCSSEIKKYDVKCDATGNYEIIITGKATLDGTQKVLTEATK